MNSHSTQFRHSIYLLISALFITCSSNSEIDLKGKWMMVKVIQQGNDVSEEHNPFNERYVVINEDGSFLSGGRPFGENTGKYDYSASDHTLFLDSDVGPEDDSYWQVSFKGDTMHWQGFGTEWAEDFELMHLKAE